jgi:hypothetical protein
MDCLFTKAKEDNNYVYYRCRNRKTKNCSSLQKLNKETLVTEATPHSDKCRISEKRLRDNRVLGIEFGYSSDDKTLQFGKQAIKPTQSLFVLPSDAIDCESSSFVESHRNETMSLDYSEIPNGSFFGDSLHDMRFDCDRSNLEVKTANKRNKVDREIANDVNSLIRSCEDLFTLNSRASKENMDSK